MAYITFINTSSLNCNLMFTAVRITIIQLHGHGKRHFATAKKNRLTRMAVNQSMKRYWELGI
uniref:Transposase n=2 Tax=Heterorhabditis bacteriophora TaxID=37862 RepID=A0A1I7X0C7_HETBA